MTRRYAEHARRPGELSTGEAAEVVERHPETVRLWAKEALSGGAAPISTVRKDSAGRYWLDGDEVRAAARSLQDRADRFL